jgi:hypothetical protein
MLAWMAFKGRFQAPLLPRLVMSSPPQVGFRVEVEVVDQEQLLALV